MSKTMLRILHIQAAITAISISKDHKIVYVGDERGRIFSWSVPDNPGRTIADHWVKDEGAVCVHQSGSNYP